VPGITLSRIRIFAVFEDEDEDDYKLKLPLRTSSAICFTTSRAACSTSGEREAPKLKSRPRMLNRTAFGERNRNRNC
jgi:hypothetical protein